MSRRRARDVYDLLVPGLRDLDAASEVGKRVRRYTPEQVRQCLEPRPPLWQRRVDGCLLCTGEATAAAFGPLTAEFRQAARYTRGKGKKRKAHKSRIMSIRQRKMILRFFAEDDDDKPVTLCRRHVERVFGIHPTQTTHILLRRQEIMDAPDDGDRLADEPDSDPETEFNWEANARRDAKYERETNLGHEDDEDNDNDNDNDNDDDDDGIFDERDVDDGADLERILNELG